MQKSPGPYGQIEYPVPGLPGIPGDQTMQSVQGKAGAVYAPDTTYVPLQDPNDDATPGWASGSKMRVPAGEEVQSVPRSMLEVVKQNPTFRAWDRLNRPDFNGEEIVLSEFLKNVPMQLNESEISYLGGLPKTADAMQYGIEQIEKQRKANEAFGAHPVAGLVASFIDPSNFIPLGTYGLATRAAFATRTAIGAGIGAATMGALTAMQEGPVTDGEVAMNLLLGAAGGALGAAVARPAAKVLPDAEVPPPGLSGAQGGTPVPDPTIPPEGLVAGAAALAKAEGAAPKPRYRLVSPAVWEDQVVPGTEPEYGWVTDTPPSQVLPRELTRSSPKMGYQKQNYTIKFASDVDRAAYVLAGTGRSKAHQQFLDWGISLGLTEEQLIKHGQTIREALKAKIKANGNPGGVIEVTDGGLMGKPRAKRVITKEGTPATTKRVKVKEAVWEEVLPEPVPQAKAAEAEVKAKLGADATPDDAAIATAEKQVEAEQKRTLSKAEKAVGKRLEWSIAKTFESFGAVGAKVSQFLFDRPGSVGNSIDSIREANYRELMRFGSAVEDGVREAMRIRGSRWWNTFTPGKSVQLQNAIEDEVRRVLQARELAGHRGLPVKEDDILPEIKKIADAQERFANAAKGMSQRAGVEGMDGIRDIKGYFHRSWSSVQLDGAMRRLMQVGLTERKAKMALRGLFARGVVSMNPGIDGETAKAIGAAIVDRAFRKGDFADNAWHSPHSGDDIREIVESLKASGVRDSQMQYVIQLLQGRSDEAGKVSFAKGRIMLDYDTDIKIGNSSISIGDLVDSRLITVNEKYMRSVATNAALAQKGIRKASELDAMRSELIESLPLGSQQRKDAEQLFQSTMNWYYGRPEGIQANRFMRNMQGVNRTIALRNGGLWQITEYATAIAEYGAGAVLKYTLKSSELFQKLMQPDAETAQSLVRVLGNYSEQSTRLRPYLSMFEDGYAIANDEAINLTLQKLQQATPYANGMKYVHAHQSRLVANLIMDRIISAGKGNAKAREALAKYGLDSVKLDQIGLALKTYGDNVDAWPPAIWDSVRPALVGMMDEAVLRARLGDLPAFAAFDELGKFLMTFRSFTLAAHNKLLARKLQQDGAGAVGLVLMYQMPLTALALQAQSVVSGEGLLDEKELILKIPGQMGGLGLLSDAFKLVSGQMQDAGVPGLIPINRMVTMVNQVGQGDLGGTAGAAVGLIPVLAAIPFTRALQTELNNLDKEE